MSTAHLSRLESLSQTRADQTRGLVDRQREELSVMDQHQLELQRINRDYQDSLVGETPVAPQLLAQRRAFVAQLTQKLDLLSLERQKREQLLQCNLSRHQEQRAQTAAIGALVEKRQQQEQQSAMRLEQSAQDQAVQGGRHVSSMNREQEDDR